MNVLTNIYYFYLRKIAPGFTIDKNALVVDLGSGDKPFWRADVYVDKLLLGNVQRASKSQTIHDLGEFVDSDVSRMPFKNKSFDFSFCSHLLEHVDDPEKVIKEIVRVSKSGYIEVPNGILETIQPFNSHLWFVFQNNDTLIFFRKSKQLHDVLAKNGIRYPTLLNEVKPPFIRLYWEGKIKYQIIDDYSKNKKFQSEIGDGKHTNNSFNVYLLLIKFIRKLYYQDKNLSMKKLIKK